MVIHAGGGEADVEILPDRVSMVLTDHGPGIPDVELAMQEGWSTAPDNVRNLGFGAGMGLPNIKKYTDYMDIKTEIGKGDPDAADRPRPQDGRLSPGLFRFQRR